MIRRSLAVLLAWLFPRQEAPALPRYEIQVVSPETTFLLDHKEARKYPFLKEEAARTALGMVRRGEPPFLLSVPFTKHDARKARP